jgi:hypothetical protein
VRLNFEKLEPARVREGRFASNTGDRFGAFEVIGPIGRVLTIMAADSNGVDEAQGWEHVSVSTSSRCPNWAEMCYIKDLFWAPDECVVQYHPPRKDYVNVHDYTLHMWRHPALPFPMPPKVCV